MNAFAFRFDIDTPTCLGEGVGPLIDLAERLNVRFTFFLNVGRAVSIPNFIKGKVKRPASPASPTAAALSAREKLGNRNYLYTALVNPRVGPRYPKVVERLADSQELGLHGGRNHDLWHHNVRTWSAQRLTAEVEWALTWLQKRGIKVEGFSAPGWSDRPDLAATLEQFGFSYRADRHGAQETWGRREGNLINVATNLTGEPGGVAYVEHQRALGRNDDELVRDFDRRLDASPNYAVVYDHPYYAGVKDLPMVETLVRRALDRGYAIKTLGEIARLCHATER